MVRQADGDLRAGGASGPNAARPCLVQLALAGELA